MRGEKRTRLHEASHTIRRTPKLRLAVDCCTVSDATYAAQRGRDRAIARRRKLNCAMDLALVQTSSCDNVLHVHGRVDTRVLVRLNTTHAHFVGCHVLTHLP